MPCKNSRDISGTSLYWLIAFCSVPFAATMYSSFVGSFLLSLLFFHNRSLSDSLRVGKELEPI